MDVISKGENYGKRPACGRRRFLAWNALALLSLLLGRRRSLTEPPVDNDELPGHEARYYRKVGPVGERD
jgi:hypothetical protein